MLKNNTLWILTFQRPSDGETKRAAACRSVGPFYLTSNADNPNRCQSDGFRTSERVCARRSAFLYSPALAQPDLRARPQRTRPHRCRNALLSVGRSPPNTPLLPKQEETFVDRLIWFTHFENQLKQNNTAWRSAIKRGSVHVKVLGYTTAWCIRLISNWSGN